MGKKGTSHRRYIKEEKMKYVRLHLEEHLSVKEYVRNQLQEDIASDQMCLKEFKDPFTGEPVVKGK